MTMDNYGFGDEELTADEESAFNSMMTGGKAGSDPDPDPAPTMDTGTEPKPGATVEKPEPDDAEAVTIDENGRARNARGKFVPLNALHSEREEHKKTRADLQNERIEKTRYSERLTMLLEAIMPQEAEKASPAAASKPASVVPVNIEEDLLGAIKQLQEHLPRVDQAHQSIEELRQSRAQDAERSRVGEISNRYQSEVQSARSDTEKMPHFEDAVKFLVAQQDGLLKAQGWTDPAARRKEIESAERNFVVRAYQDNANAAHRLYEMAQAVGWKAPAAGENGGQKVANGAVAQKIDNIARMQKASNSLSNVVGGGGDGLPSPQQIAAMDEEDFSAFVKKVGGDRAFEKRYLGRA